MLRDLTGSVVVLSKAAECPGLAGVIPDPFLQLSGGAVAEGGQGKGSAVLSSPTEGKREGGSRSGAKHCHFLLN